MAGVTRRPCADRSRGPGGAADAAPESRSRSTSRSRRPKSRPARPGRAPDVAAARRPRSLAASCSRCLATWSQAERGEARPRARWHARRPPPRPAAQAASASSPDPRRWTRSRRCLPRGRHRAPWPTSKQASASSWRRRRAYARPRPPRSPGMPAVAAGRLVPGDPSAIGRRSSGQDAHAAAPARRRPGGCARGPRRRRPPRRERR